MGEQSGVVSVVHGGGISKIGLLGVEPLLCHGVLLGKGDYRLRITEGVENHLGMV